MCDRIYLLYDGRIKAELENGKDPSERIIHLVTEASKRWKPKQRMEK